MKIQCYSESGARTNIYDFETVVLLLVVFIYVHVVNGHEGQENVRTIRPLYRFEYMSSEQLTPFRQVPPTTLQICNCFV